MSSINDKPPCAAGHTAAGISAQSPVAAHVLAAGQGMRRKSRLQHVTAAEDEASPSGQPEQATPGSAAAALRAAAHQQGPGHTPQGSGQLDVNQCDRHTPGTGGGSGYMTPPTSAAQRPAVS